MTECAGHEVAGAQPRTLVVGAARGITIERELSSRDLTPVGMDDVLDGAASL